MELNEPQGLELPDSKITFERWDFLQKLPGYPPGNSHIPTKITFESMIFLSSKVGYVIVPWRVFTKESSVMY